MKLYNTLTRKIEEFVPYDEQRVTMYTCGPTVYYYAHIGNLSCYIREDVLEKSLKFLGYPIYRVMNITDVGHLSSDSDTGEDKMLKGAKKEKKSILDLARFYTDEFFKDCKKLNIKKPDVVAPATEHINDYINVIKTLLEKEIAYESNGNIYFDITKVDMYYQLTGDQENEMVVGVRKGVEKDNNKKHQADFVLWFTKSKFDSQELKWESPWGIGYPGWHIECSCISMKYLGEYLDIHCGAIDNIFPHHTNEIAQSEAFLGHKWCKYWFHPEHLNLASGKMSKSKGNLFRIVDLEKKGFNPLSFRLLCLQSHYRKSLMFSIDILKNTENAYNKLLSKVSEIKEDGNIDAKSYENYLNKFKNALEDDLNTSYALTVLYDLIKDDEVNNSTKLLLIEEYDKVLGLDLLKKQDETETEEQKKYIMEMIEKRNQAKREKDFAKADKIRNVLEEKGIILVDTREGTTYKLK